MFFSQMKFLLKKSREHSFLWMLVIIFWIANLSYRPSVWNVVGSIGVMAVFFGLCLLVTGKWRTSAWWLTIIGIGLWFLNAGKRIFWKERLKFEDVTIFTDPANFETVLHYPLECASASVLLIGLILLGYKAFVADCSYMTVARRILISIVIIAVGTISANFALKNGQQQWMVNIGKGSNVIANLLMSSKIQYTSPGAIMASTEKFPLFVPTANLKKPLSDVVVILQESTMNPIRFKGIDPKSLPGLAMFDSPYATQKGLLRVHTYGGAHGEVNFLPLLV